MSNVIIYTTANCPYCDRAKQLLKIKNAAYQEVRVDQDPVLRQDMITKTGLRTVPQIFINNEHIGGCDDLYALDRAGKLDHLLVNI